MSFFVWFSDKMLFTLTTPKFGEWLLMNKLCIKNTFFAQDWHSVSR